MGASNAGYKLNPADKFALIVDLMNDNMQDKVVYLTITYDVIQGHPANYDDIKPIWFDLAQCSTSEVPPPQQAGMMYDRPWLNRADMECRILEQGVYLAVQL
jgi:hypothetical protein